jgi:hypothetical protein
MQAPDRGMGERWREFPTSGRRVAFLHKASHGDNIDLCISSAAKVRDTP